MKYINLIIIVFSFMSCKAQTTALFQANPDMPDGSYYKDLDNDLDKFAGTWQWQDASNNSLTIVLEKRENVYDGEYYNDLIVGEYKYLTNGIEVVNTLSNIGVTNNNIELVSLKDNSHPPYCQNCDQNERRVQALFIDPERRYLMTSIIFRHVTEGNIEKLEALLYDSASSVLPEEDSPQNIRVPIGEYILIKQ